MYVTLGSYEIREDADKYGKDVCVKLPMKEWKPWGAKELVIKKKKSSLIFQIPGNSWKRKWI